MPRRFMQFVVSLLVCAAAAVGWSHVAVGQQRGGGRAAPAVPAAPAGSDWPTYGHDPGGMRYSPLEEITPANVSQLQPAWVYHMKPASPAGAPPPQGRGGRVGFGSGFGAGETTPL